MRANIDGDIILYALGSATDDEGHPLKWPYVKTRVDGKIHQIASDALCDDYTVYLTGDNNFRKHEATILPYKGNRKGKEKPIHHQRIKDYLLSTKNHKVILCEDYEADDGLSIDQTEDTVLCSNDKDLDITAGKHFQWGVGSREGKGLYEVTEVEGIRWFFKQLLMGDSTDNILGLFGVGKKSKLVSDLNSMESYQRMYDHVQKKYEDRFGSYWKLFMHENSRLLWMLQHENDDIRHKLNVWELFRMKDKLIVEKY